MLSRCPPRCHLAGRAARLLGPLALAPLCACLGLAPAAGWAQGGSAEPSTVLSGYGELNVNLPRRAEAQADLRRFVLALLHRFDDATKLVSELEVEHAVSSSSDRGEVEVEQAYIDRQLGDTWSVQAGLFLMPMGLLNENHEPTSYYGVERNFVETAIIPSTWREGGLQATAVLPQGLSLRAGLTTSFDLTRWDATSTEGRDSPLGSVHQELQLAKAHDLAGHLALDWRGVPGLQLGGAAFAGNATQGTAGAPRAVVAIWDLHARWTPARFDLSALYTRATISGTGRLDASLSGQPVPIPARFDGWYAQAAYRAFTRGDLALSPFARYEEWNTGRSYPDLGPGLTPAPLPTQEVVTAGLSLFLAGGVVVKADVQSFRRDHDQDRLDLGLGWSF
ncbi:MAG TPA: hypothetical protein VMU15_14085 [Anaeromyxobacter sp.]|nr:hypothetical protein [Anaeromyxobacter sp.]